MDKILINNLEVYAYHGVFKEENFLGQKFIISMELYMDLSQAAKNDELEKSVNYALVCKFAEELFTKRQFKLIESCAETLANEILKKFELIQGIKVTVKKPWAPIGCHLDDVGVSIKRRWHRVFLGLGSNMGDKEANLNNAIKALETETAKLVKTSSFITTEPVGYLDQEDFLNCAVEIKTLLSPMDLLDFIMNIELSLKRERTIRWGPRTIDIDILMYDDLIMQSEQLIIPHERMTERAFVLEPLSQIAPYAIHPLEEKRIIQLYTNFKEQNK